MYYKIVAILVFTCPKFLLGQVNLVPNPSFEEYTHCPTGLSNICEAIGWFQPNIVWGSVCNSGSSDYHNSCTNIPHQTVPYNWAGYQYPRTGNGYAGIAIFCVDSVNTFREYIEVKLNSTLTKNKKYCVQFYISLANKIRVGATGMGAYFSNDSLLENSEDLTAILFQPQVHASGAIPISDTVGWVEISGEFIAQGGEKFMTIGNFIDGNSIIYQINDTTGQPFAYYYIDDVSVIACDTGIGINKHYASVSKLYTSQNEEWVFENPSNKGISLEVFNSLGQVVFKKVIYEEKVVFYPNLKSGIYYWQANGQRGKVVVE